MEMEMNIAVRLRVCVSERETRQTNSERKSVFMTMYERKIEEMWVWVCMRERERDRGGGVLK